MIVAVLQARASSKRLPGKVLRPILGRPMLAHQIMRIRRCETFERLVLATSEEAADDPVAGIAKQTGIACYRGSLDDVLDRFYRAAAPYAPQHVVRLTGDCPLADWNVIDRVVRFTLEGGYDYGTNTLKPTWPDGLDVEVAAFAALETAWREATNPLDREHVTPFIYRQTGRFRLGNLLNDTDLAGLRWTVDNPEDFEFVTRVYEALYPQKPDFSTPDILALLARHPEIGRLNDHIPRNAGYYEALLKQKGTASDG
jgi:spore coat polysaccharide biosynthesis protein SpsF (cytidylyltransferase family)